MPENNRGTLTPFQLPPTDVVWPELQEPIKEYRELVGKRRAATARLTQLENQRNQAVEADRVALAKALREGKPDPGNKAVEKIDQDIVATRRIVAALETAIYDAEADLIDTVSEHEVEWKENVEGNVSEAADEYLAVVEELEKKRQALMNVLALRSFVHNFPERGYNPVQRKVFGLIAQHGDPFNWVEVVEALRKDAETARKPVAPVEREAVSEGRVVEHLHTPESFKDAVRNQIPSRNR